MQMQPMLRSLYAATLSFLTVAVMAVSPVHGQVFNGGGVEAGLGAAGQIKGPVNTGLRALAVKILINVLNVLALVAVIVIVVAGIRLIVSQGEPEQIEKSRKTIIWAAAGLVVVLLARVLVEFTIKTIAG